MDSFSFPMLGSVEFIGASIPVEYILIASALPLLCVAYFILRSVLWRRKKNIEVGGHLVGERSMEDAQSGECRWPKLLLAVKTAEAAQQTDAPDEDVRHDLEMKVQLANSLLLRLQQNQSSLHLACVLYELASEEAASREALVWEWVECSPALAASGTSLRIHIPSASASPFRARSTGRRGASPSSPLSEQLERHRTIRTEERLSMLLGCQVDGRTLTVVEGPAVRSTKTGNSLCRGDRIIRLNASPVKSASDLLSNLEAMRTVAAARSSHSRGPSSSSSNRSPSASVSESVLLVVVVVCRMHEESGRETEVGCIVRIPLSL